MPGQVPAVPDSESHNGSSIYDSSDEFDEATQENVFITNERKMVQGGGQSGTVFLRRPIDTHSDDVFNFKIINTRSMNIWIGCYLVEPTHAGGVKTYQGKHFWVYNL